MLTTISENRSHGGVQGVYSAPSKACGVDMTFSVFVPPHAEGEKLPVVWYLSGLTCTPANVTEKGEFRAACAKLGLIFVCPDTSPRGEGVADDPDGAYDLGLGAGFYVDATEEPYAQHYCMWTHVTDELPEIIGEAFPADMSRQSIMGHSMGGHGALTIGLRLAEQYRSVSAFAPIVAPSQVPWGQKAFPAYLGTDKTHWRQHDAVALIEDGAYRFELKVDQGTADTFLEGQLKPELLRAACDEASIRLDLQMREGYDHSYYFISSFMTKHLEWHAERLR